MSKMFTVGPVSMYPSTLRIRGEQIPYFRTNDFSEIMLDSEERFKRLVRADPSSKVVFLTSSGTGAMEASVINFFDRNDRLLVISGGSFGHRFEEICELHGIAHDAVRLKFGEVLTAENLKEFEDNEYAGLLVNIDETSTGQLYDVGLLSDFCRRKGMLFVVDAISSFLADDLDMVRDGIDVLFTGSQKALSLSPGIAIVVMDTKAIDRMNGIKPASYYFDIRVHLTNQVRGQTPFTPAVGTLLELNDMLCMIEADGLEARLERSKTLAEYFRDGARALGLKVPDYPLSNAVTPLVFEDGAYALFETLKEKYDILVTPSGGDLRNKLLRVGHIGNLGKEDYDALLSAMKEVLQ